MRKSIWFLLAAVPTVLGMGVAAFVVIRAQHSLDRAGLAVEQMGRFPFTLRAVGKQENPGFEAIASPASYNSGAFYHGKLYVSGPSGLSVLGAADVTRPAETMLLRSYRAGLDLPTAPLRKIVSGRLRGMSEPELMIATSGAGVLFFSDVGRADGAGSFRQLLPEDPEARDVTALLPLPTGELLMGTRKRGLLVYRGLTGDKALESFSPQLNSLAITALAADTTGVWIGTQTQGVLHWHGGQMDRFDAQGAGGDAGLPDEQVDAIAVRDDKVYVGTPLGVEEFTNGRPARRLANRLFAHSLYAGEKELTVGSMGDGIVEVSLDLSRRRGGLSRDLGHPIDGNLDDAEEFLSADQAGSANQADSSEAHGGVLYAVRRDGVSRRQEGGSWTPVAVGAGAVGSKQSAPVALTDGNISALAFDPEGRLWVGYFDRGLDVLETNGERKQHYEDDRLFCVNRIVSDATRNTMAVATANGLVMMDARSDLRKPRQVMTRRDGLIADHVTDVAFDGETMVVATPAGLTFVDGGGVRSLYAFEGLVNNHVYALGVRPRHAGSDDGIGDGTILAGTLGGVSELRHEAVARNLTVSNSGLKHNWVTAMVPAGEADAWFVGTYGAGVMLLGKDGNFAAMEGVTRAMEINPNAMLRTSSHVYAGTLGDGLWVWSRAQNRWRQVTAGLPSLNVTAIAEHGGEIYVGTENGLVRIAESALD